MSTFSNIPGIDPSQHSIEAIAQATWKALQILEFKESSDWTPTRSQATVWQVDRANTWKIYMFPKRFQLFSYYGEEKMANRIIKMIPEFVISKTKVESLEQKRNYNSGMLGDSLNSFGFQSNLSPDTKNACFKVDAGQKERILKNISDFTELARISNIMISTENEKKN